jgi:hypothetical protein
MILLSKFDAQILSESWKTPCQHEQHRDKTRRQPTFNNLCNSKVYRPPNQGGPPASSHSKAAKLASVLESPKVRVGLGIGVEAEVQTRQSEEAVVDAEMEPIDGSIVVAEGCIWGARSMAWAKVLRMLKGELFLPQESEFKNVDRATESGKNWSLASGARRQGSGVTVRPSVQRTSSLNTAHFPRQRQHPPPPHSAACLVHCLLSLSLTSCVYLRAYKLYLVTQPLRGTASTYAELPTSGK